MYGQISGFTLYLMFYAGVTVLSLIACCYLSQYFSSLGTTYNAYINDLRINHFIRLYRETTTAMRPVTAQQLANDSGYRSYSTFSLAFKQRTGQTVTAWIRDTAQQ